MFSGSEPIAAPRSAWPQASQTLLSIFLCSLSFPQDPRESLGYQSRCQQCVQHSHNLSSIDEH